MLGCRSANAITGPPLEQLLMRRHSVKYVKARKLVLEMRTQLRMTRREPWTEELRRACERRLNGGSTDPIEPTEKETERVEDIEIVSPNIVEAQLSLPKLDVKTWLEKQRIDMKPSSTEEESDQSMEKLFFGVHLADVDLSVAERTEAQMIADDCSETSDNTKCFTTAEEVGVEIDFEAAATIIESIQKDPSTVDEDDSSSDSDSGSSSSSETVPTVVQDPVKKEDPPASGQAEVASTKRAYTEARTVGTSVDSDTGIPLVIYIRRGRKEVPDDEPLGECYNIPMQFLPHLKQRRFGEKIADRLRKFTGIGKRNKVRLDEDDTEVRHQTLVDC